jgi:DNA-directed RNA polymerase alpha subunit
VAPENRRRRQQKKDRPQQVGITEEERAAHHQRRLLATPVAEMDLSVRVINTLEDYGVIYAREIVVQTYGSLMQMSNFGEATLKELRKAVRKLGLPVPKWRKAKSPRPRKRRGLLDQDEL